MRQTLLSTVQLNKMAILKEIFGQNERNVKISIRTQRILQPRTRPINNHLSLHLLEERAIIPTRVLRNNPIDISHVKLKTENNRFQLRSKYTLAKCLMGVPSSQPIQIIFKRSLLFSISPPLKVTKLVKILAFNPLFGCSSSKVDKGGPPRGGRKRERVLVWSRVELVSRNHKSWAAIYRDK